MPVASPAAEPTPQSGTLESAAQAIEGLLSPPKGRRAPAARTKSQSEPPAPPAGSADAAASEAEDEESPPAGSEQAEVAEPEESDEEAEASPALRTVKVDGEEVEVTEDELLKGYSRTADYTRKSQRLAEERRKFEMEEVAQVRAERAKYADALSRMEEAITSLQPEEPDWTALKAALPADQFATRWIEWRESRDRLDKLRAEKAQAVARQAEDARRQFGEYYRREEAALLEAIPEMADADKGPKLATELTKFGRSLGFSDEELVITDHRLVRVLHEAYLHHQAQKAAPKVQNKIERAMKPSAPGARTSAPRGDKLKVAKDRARQTGTLDDAAAAIEQLLE